MLNKRSGLLGYAVAGICVVVAGCSEFTESDTTSDITVETIQLDAADADSTSDANDAVSPEVDVSQPDIPPPPGCEEDPGAFECPCVENGTCNSGYCIEGADGLMCTKGCIEDCPAGYGCVTTGGLGPDPVSVCVPQHLSLCRPCNDNDECTNTLVDSQLAVCVPGSNPSDGKFCATSCAAGLACPEDFACVTETLPGGVSTKLCRPTSGVCGCRPSWATQGFSTECSVENQYGSCSGVRSCGANGLGSCEGGIPGPEFCNGIDDDCDGGVDNLIAVSCELSNTFGTCPGTLACGDGGVESCQGTEPQAEICNAIDDDCDGDLDEGTCEDGLECTADTCDANGECQNPLIAGYCRIEGTCYAAGAANPGDPCESCKPGLATGAWSDADGASCNDGQACTWNDKCNAGVCTGTPYVCNDGLGCTADLCDGTGDCLQELTGDFCLIQGGCVSGGTLKPDGSCFVCAPSQSPKNWFPNDGGACDDGNPCTSADSCAGITCAGTSYTCDDGDSCTDDQCLGDGNCNNIPASTSCTIAGTCYADGTVRPGFPCQVCVAATSNNSWTTAPGDSPCEDGQPCTHSDKCVAGSCFGVSYVCNDGLPCTTDTCDGTGACLYPPDVGKCAIDFACYDHGDGQPGNSCLQCDANLNPTDWLPQAPGSACTDDQSCTNDDTCNSSAQCVGVGQVCNDGLACTVDNCDGAGGCTYTPVGACLINGNCYSSGQSNPSNPCEVCNPGISTTSWVGGSGAQCNDGNPCTYSDACVAGACLGTSYSCSDGKTCTTDVCGGNGPNDCSYTVANNWCYISGNCYADNAVNPANSCERCNDIFNTTWSPKSGSCTDGDVCTSGDTCNAGQCVGTNVKDGFEDNNTSSAYTSLTTKSDNSSFPGDASSATATLFGPGDEDWFRFLMLDNTNVTDLVPDVRVDISNIPINSNYQVCAYWDCTDATGEDETISGCNGTASTLNGHPGCCRNVSGSQTESVQFEGECNTTWVPGNDNDEGYVYIRVFAAPGNQWSCQPYTITYGDQ